MDEAQIEIRCPGCGARYWVEREQLGMVAECGNCGHEFTVAEGPADGAAAAVTVALEGEVGKSNLTISSYLRERGVTAGGVSLEETRSATDVLQTDSGRKYAVGDVLAKGGMGAILHCRDLNIRRNVAMKVMLDPQLADSPQILRFIEEAQITGQLEHPGIVPVHELGVDTGDNVFYTMKFVHGKTLKDILAALAKGDAATVAAFPLSRLLNVFQRVCEAVAYAHHKHVIHRDLKPENIMVGDFGEVYVMDWGLAKLVGAGEAELPAESRSVVTYARDEFRAESVNTLDGAIMGTPHYMAPEQAEGKVAELDARADIYALGGILYEILALRHAVDGKTLRELLRKVIAGDLIPLPTDADPAARPHCPAGRIPNSLAAVARKALALAPADRYATVKDLQAEIEAYQAGFATDAEGAGLLRQLGLLVKRHKAEFALAAAAFVVLVAVVAGFMVKVTKEKNNAVVAQAAEARQREAAVAAERSALLAKEKAETAEAQTKKAYTELEYENYVNLIASADAKIKAGDYNEAEELLWTTPERLRHWEWGYLLGESRPGLLALPGKRGQTYCAVSPDGCVLATGGFGNRIRLWDLRTGRCIRELPLRKESSVTSLDFSVDGKVLIAGVFSNVSSWDLGTGQLLTEIKSRGEARAILLAEGKHIVVSDQTGSVRVLDMVTGAEVTSLVGLSRRVWALGASRDGAYVAAGGDDKVLCLWEQTSGNRVWSAELDRIYCLSFSHDGRTLAVGSSRDVQIRDTRTGELKQTLAHRGDVFSCAFSGDDHQLVTGNEFGEVTTWDLGEGKQKQCFRGSSFTVYRTVFCLAERLVASAGRDGTVRLWATTTREQGTSATPPGKFLALPRDGTHLVATSWDKVARVLDTDTGERVVEFGAHSARIECVAFSPDGKKVATGCLDGVVRIWDARTGTEKSAFRGHEGGVASVSWSPDGNQILANSYDGPARMWDCNSGTEIRRFRGSPGRSYRAVLSPDGHWVAVADGQPNKVTLWDARTGAERISYMDEHTRIEAMAFSPDGTQLATGGQDQTVSVHETSTGRRLFSLAGHRGFLWSLAFSPDGRRIVTGAHDRTVRVWDSSTGRELLVIPASCAVTSVVFHPSGFTLMAVGAHTLTSRDWTLTREQIDEQRLAEYRKWVAKEDQSQATRP